MTTELCAEDIMTGRVLMAYEGWSIKRLADFFIKNHISGAPVIASDHSLVGVVTSSDILQFGARPAAEKTRLLQEVYAEYVGQEYPPDLVESLAARAGERCTVNQIMSPRVVQVDIGASLQEVAYVMLQQGIRRVFVCKRGIIAGVISTHNLLTVIARQGLSGG